MYSYINIKYEQSYFPGCQTKAATTHCHVDCDRELSIVILIISERIDVAKIIAFYAFQMHIGATKGNWVGNGTISRLFVY